MRTDKSRKSIVTETVYSFLYSGGSWNDLYRGFVKSGMPEQKHDTVQECAACEKAFADWFHDAIKASSDTERKKMVFDAVCDFLDQDKDVGHLYEAFVRSGMPAQKRDTDWDIDICNAAMAEWFRKQIV
jgi:hypothetical protein